MTRVAVDLTLCQGYANCIAVAPQVFDLDDAGQAVLLKVELDDPADIAAVEAAIPLCPVAAVSLED